MFHEKSINVVDFIVFYKQWFLLKMGQIVVQHYRTNKHQNFGRHKETKIWLSN